MPQSASISPPPSDPELEFLLREFLSTQVALGENVANTSRFLKSVLIIVNANMEVIQNQLVKIQDLAAAIEIAHDA